MNIDICSLCGEQIDYINNNKDLKEIVFKYLQITISEECIGSICQKCEEMLVLFDEFAKKCLLTQSLLEENKLNHHFIKVEGESFAEIKVENSFNNIDENDDKCSVSNCNLKNADPLSTIKKEQTNKLCDIKINETIITRSQKQKSIESNNKKPKKMSDKAPKVDNHKDLFIDYTCHVCEIALENWLTLEMHCEKEHSTTPKVICICGKYLTSKGAIKYHRWVHDDSRGYKCEKCGKKYDSSSCLKMHMYIHVPKEEYAFTCSQCPKKFPTLKKLDMHSATHLPAEVRVKHTCDICGATLATKCGLKMHKVALHDKPKDYVCDECGHAFSWKVALAEHKATHMDKRDFKCDKCSKSFKTMNILKRHEDTHNEAVLQCPQCPAIFKSRRNLLSHRTVHIDIFKFSCKICNKYFKRNDSLKKHMNSHDGLKPYNCQWCPKIFSTKQNLRHHKQRVHSGKIDDDDAAACKDEFENGIIGDLDTSDDFLHSDVRLNI